MQSSATLSAQWKELIDLGMYDESYPQRIQSCFNYFVSNCQSQLTTFNLKDFIDKATFGMRFLSIDVEDNEFAVMDLYRLFDRSGRGTVNVNDFVLGVIQKLHSSVNEVQLLESIAAELLSIESRGLELAALLEKVSNNGNHPFANISKFRKNLKAFSSYICNAVRDLPDLENLSALDIQSLVQCFQDSILLSIKESADYFNIDIMPMNEVKQLSPGPSEQILRWNLPKLLRSNYPWMTSYDLALKDAYNSSNENLLTLGRTTTANSSSHDWRPLSTMRDKDSDQQLGVLHDTSQLYLLQDAFLSLQTFFKYLETYQDSQESLLNNGSAALRQQLEFVAHALNASNSMGSKNYVNHTEQNIDSAMLKFEQLWKRYFADHSDAEILENGQHRALFGILVEELLRTQDLLRRAQCRVELFESIQSHLMSSYRYENFINNTESPSFDMKSFSCQLRNGLELSIPEIENGSLFAMSEDVSCDERYDEILQELQSLECQIGERSQKDYAFGLLLDERIAVIKEQYLSDECYDSEKFSSVVQHLHVDFEELKTLYLQMVENLKHKDLHQLESINKIQNQSLSKHQFELKESEHSELLKLTLELQIVREHNLLLLKQQQEFSSLTVRNQDLQRLVNDLQQQLKERNAKDVRKADAFIDSTNSFTISKESLDVDSFIRLNSKTVSPNMSSDENRKQKDELNNMNGRYHLLQQQYESLQKENLRSKSTIQLCETQIKSILQDSLLLHQQINLLQEENSTQNNRIVQLTQQCNDSSHFKQVTQEQEKRLHELNREITKKNIIIQELQDNMILLNKYHSDLLQAERTIEVLETKISDYSVELEKGFIINNQLHKLRDIIQKKTNENSNLNLKIYQLENSNQDIPYYTSRIQEMVDEISDMKMKIEKIPGLLAEISRLRGSSRASLKSLQEQDKLLSNYKNRVKVLEKENLLLKHDNQSLQDLENKLKDSNNEVKRLMNALTEIQNMKLSARNVEEEKKIVEGQYKKMRKFMRQSVLTAPIGNNGGSTLGSVDQQSES